MLFPLMYCVYAHWVIAIIINHFPVLQWIFYDIISLSKNRLM